MESTFDTNIDTYQQKFLDSHFQIYSIILNHTNNFFLYVFFETYLKFAELKALSYMSITDSKISTIHCF